MQARQTSTIPEPEPALVEIVRACEKALAAAGASSSDLAASAFSLAGADWPEDFVLLRERADPGGSACRASRWS